ncbi:MAG: hypothetical protein ACP5KK_00815 [Candidatus Nanoarchaeia archaeon]
MEKVNMETLDDLVQALQAYEPGRQEQKEYIANLTEKLDESVNYGYKQQVKDTLLEKLGYEIEPDKIRGSLYTIVASILYLKDLGVKKIDKVVEKHPQVLAYSIESMQDRVDWLRELGVKKIDKVVEQLPQVLACNIEGMQDRVDWLRELGVEDISKFVEKRPQVLGCDIQKMFDRYSYITNPEKTPFSIKDIEHFPAALTYSFERRIVPRFEFIRAKQGSLDGWSLNKILKPKDTDFVKKLGTSLEEYLKFMEEVAREAKRYLVEA